MIKHDYDPGLSINLTCIVTGKSIPDEFDEKDYENIDFTINSFESAARNDGSAAVIRCGYGSKFDGHIFLVGISDEALEEGLKNGRVVKLGEYF